MEEDFNFSDVKPIINFKELFFKLLKNWWLFVLFILVSFTVAYQINLRKKSKYSVGSQIVVSNDKNPFFTSNTNIAFNWGGASDKIQTTLVLFKSRSHNEKVVEYLQYFTNYHKQEKYWESDAYKKIPFKVFIDTASFQMLNNKITITPIDQFKYQLSYEIKSNSVLAQHYGTKNIKNIHVSPKIIKEIHQFGVFVLKPYLKFKIDI
jgi:uncharacterized protein involved in exopolysaccharide biosynthesis